MHAGFPAGLVDRLKDIVPEGRLEAVLGALDAPRAVAFRVNRLRSGAEPVLQELRETGIACRPAPEWFPDAWLVNARDRTGLTHSRPASEGRLYVQNLSSMLPPLLLAPRPGEEVLDLCAAPGSKTTQLAVLMENRGRIAAVEAVRPRFHRLRANLRQQGVTIARTYLADGRGIGRKTPGRFDRVLLDAPCSSEAGIRRARPETWSTWSPRKIREQARKQVRLLGSAAEALRPGGRLVYSTCTFAPEENEAVVQAVLDRHDGRLRVVPVTLPFPNVQPGLSGWSGHRFDPALRGAVRVLPDGVMEAFFVCVLEKGG